MEKREALASIALSNTAALLITDIDDFSESVTYCISVLGEEKAPKNHHAKIHYTIRNGEPYFTSIIGRMHLSQAMKITPFEI